MSTWLLVLASACFYLAAGTTDPGFLPRARDGSIVPPRVGHKGPLKGRPRRVRVHMHLFHIKQNTSSRMELYMMPHSEAGNFSLTYMLGRSQLLVHGDTVLGCVRLDADFRT